MNYLLIKDIMELISSFENQDNVFCKDLDGFMKWIHQFVATNNAKKIEPNWERKENGRSAESAIITLLVHMNRYAKSYSKSAIHDSAFSTQDEFSYLITLKAYGFMTKMDLIKKNIQEKSVGMQIINRMIVHGWIKQKDSIIDKRSKVIEITDIGLSALLEQMQKIRNATKIVAGDLTYDEKMDLIRLLNKLNDFHKPIYERQLPPAVLLSSIMSEYSLN